VRAVGWDAFAAMCARMAEALEPRRPDAIVGIARGGLIPAATLARMLRIDLYPVRLTRRARDVVRHDHPAWSVPVHPDVRGRTVAVVDETNDTGETMAAVLAACRAQGARDVIADAIRRQGPARGG
jgi:hypoxanthine phosphoribosyltransferase